MLSHPEGEVNVVTNSDYYSADHEYRNAVHRCKRKNQLKRLLLVLVLVLVFFWSCRKTVMTEMKTIFRLMNVMYQHPVAAAVAAAEVV